MNNYSSWYRKKPVEIEAFQWKEPHQEVPDWAHSHEAFYPVGGNDPHIDIVTLEGTMRVDMNDWIIKGVKGEVYPCKPDIFEMTYERVN